MNTQEAALLLKEDKNLHLFHHLRLNVILLAILLFSLLVAATWWGIKENQQNLIEHQAVELAEVVSLVATSARSVYVREVVQKLKKEGYGAKIDSHLYKGFVPLPAQFLKELGQHASKTQDGLYQYRLVSKWNLEPTQGLSTDFQRWAWQQLELQDTSTEKFAVDWKAVWRIEVISGERVLRYMRADPAVSSSCVNCHNSLELTPAISARRIEQGNEPRQWRLNQLLGAIEVTVPVSGVEALASEQTKMTLYTVVAILLLGLSGIGFFIFSDFKHAKLVTSNLQWHAQHDKLTTLLNRRAFDSYLANFLDDAKSYNHEHSLMFLDLDQFKIINDTCGHMAGDQLLKEISPILQSILRDSDVIARLGGDEFGIILANCKVSKTSVIADKILNAIRAYVFIFEGREYRIGVSIGVVPVNRQCKDASELLSSADMACYAAKDRGRNQLYVLTEKEEIKEIRDQMEWPSRIDKAIENGQLQLACQTAKCLNDELKFNEYIELLIRLKDEDGQFIPTYKLIEAAELYNFIDVIDRWVTKTTFEHIHHGRIKLTAQTVVAINLSGATMTSKDFAIYVQELFDSYPEIPAEQICFEVTETAAVNNLDHANQLIDTLKTTGCLFALDDFGSGLSSLTYLKKLNVDFLKIDGSFIRDITSDHINRVMVESVVQMSKALNLPTVAEWVEDKAIYDLIKKIGISYAQGYYVHKPTIIEI